MRARETRLMPTRVGSKRCGTLVSLFHHLHTLAARIIDELLSSPSYVYIVSLPSNIYDAEFRDLLWFRVAGLSQPCATLHSTRSV